MMLNANEKRTLSETIKEVESKTDAEVVTVLAGQSDNYLYISTLWAAFIALLMAPLMQFLPWWIEYQQAFTLQWILFIVLAVLFRWRPLTMWLVPKKIKYWRAANLARRQFLEHELHSTKDRLGLLIFVSQAEHYVEILADRGLAEQITNEAWQDIVENFIREVRKGKTGEAFVHCVEKCGELLEEAAPATVIKNELPNHLVVL
ncbi:TPM domain-containing protein [Microbulbifer agarilyticus]|uniref:TPM domain-containing protein n=1 Tax=Microbulbifer agarilyticus TaxID=260552 RepID=UPI001C96420D|nr:TPM domain-containing protein [Microbulbifer agarilyticus]MBY6189774.1 TPM domain-containing protein [Microbulbifer agarilyticus]MCA0892305.1 TPM domain-containing protein [Microbulbifer agarilyticus]